MGSFRLVGRYSLRENGVSLIALTESMINFFIDHGYKLEIIDCDGMSEYDCGIIPYSKRYTVVEDFVQNALTDHKCECKSTKYELNFSITDSYLLKQDNLKARIYLDFYYETYIVNIEGVNEETKLFNVGILQSISDTIGLDLLDIEVVT